MDTALSHMQLSGRHLFGVSEAMSEKGWEKYVQPTSEWLDSFKQQRLDDMLMDLWLLGDQDFVLAIQAQTNGPWNEE